MDPSGAGLVFNVVLTGSSFRFLQYFLASQMAHSQAGYRLIANGCPPEQLPVIERFAERHPGRVVEVTEVSETMIGHGAALDVVFDRTDDGDHFCLVDPDILARGPWIPAFADALADAAAVSSGRGVWRDDDVLPEGHPGVSGEYFYGPDGYLFGSPHLALYEMGPLRATRRRWGIGFGSAGKEVTDEGRAVLRAAGQDYWIYDTAKLVNIFLQEDGNRFVHLEQDSTIHVGGLSHYFEPTGYTTHDDGSSTPDWKTWRGMETRFGVAEHAAHVVMAADAGEPVPPVPEHLEGPVRDRLSGVVDALVAMVDAHRDDVVR